MKPIALDFETLVELYLGISVETVLTLLAKGREELRFALSPSRTRSSRFPIYAREHVRRAETWPMVD